MQNSAKHEIKQPVTETCLLKPKPAEQVLLALLSSAVSSADTVPVIENAADIDWDAVISESLQQSVHLLAFDAAEIYKKEIPKATYKRWLNICVRAMIINQQVAQSQNELVKLLDTDGYDYIILKGLAAASYYPKPELRSLGDVDFLVNKNDCEPASHRLESAGYKKWNIEHNCHIVFRKPKAHLEMHFEIAGVPNGVPGDAVRSFMTGAIKSGVSAEYEGNSFKMPGDVYHGLILLLHMQHHMLGEGFGLRHLCDWACFVDKTCNDAFWAETLLPLFKKIGLYVYACVMTKTCSLYLGTVCPDWAEEASETLCCQIIRDIFDGGNFGRKNIDRAMSGNAISQHGKNGTKNGAVYNLVHTLTASVRAKYPILKKHKYLYPFLVAAAFFRYVFLMLTGRRQGIAKMLKAAKKRKSVYEQLHIFEV